MAAQQDIDFFSGNDVLLDLSTVDSLTGLPMDISGAQQLTFALAKKAGSSAPLVLKTLADGVVMVNPALGRVSIILGADETEPLKGLYYHEIRLVNSAGKKLTLAYGVVTISENLIRN